VKNTVIDTRTFFGEHPEETVFFTFRCCLVPEVTVIKLAPMVDIFDVDAYTFFLNWLIGFIEQLDNKSVGNTINVLAFVVSTDCPFVG
jgi:hypothetical protein